MVLVIIMGTNLLAGCSVEKTNRTKVRDLDYHVAAEEEIPEELNEQIEKKKTADFKLSYETPEYLYIVRGYGEQETGGYSIQVKELYLDSVRSETTPRHIMTVSDSLYLMELSLADREYEVGAILDNFRLSNRVE